MLESLIPVTVAAFISAVGWFGGKGITAGLKTVKENAEFRTSLSIGLTTIAKELSQFRSDVNTMLKEEREIHKVERQEYKETHQQLEKRIAMTEQFMARCDERISHLETASSCWIPQRNSRGSNNVLAD
jgi:hypothetical protein